MATEFDKRYSEGTPVNSVKDLKVGDHVLVYREVDVRSRGGDWGNEEIFTTKDGRDIRMGGTDYQGKPYPAFKVVKVAKPGPDNWPPTAGQVWRDDNKNDYFVLFQPGDGVKVFTVDDKIVSVEELKAKPGIKRVYNPEK